MSWPVKRGHWSLVIGHRKSGHWSLVLGHGLSVALLLALPVGARAADSWAAKAGQMNRKEISADQAEQAAQGRDEDRRNKIAIRRIKPAAKGVDWDTDPTAVPYMLYQANKRTELPVYVNNDGLDPATPELFRHTVIYFTSHNRYSLNEKEAANLALWLKRGGSILLDDCYLRGSGFAESTRPEVSKLVPGAEPILLLKEDARVADAFKIVYPTPWPGECGLFENRPWQYFVVDGRPAIFFDPNDDGCAWEVSTPPSASNPLGEGIGHGGDNTQREIVYQWAVNWLLYAYTH